MDLKNLISQEELIARRSTIKKVFFYRICGAGMGPAAVLVKQAGGAAGRIHAAFRAGRAAEGGMSDVTEFVRGEAA